MTTDHSACSIPELYARGPHPAHEPALRLYGQFVGSWDLDVTWHDPDGGTRRARGEWHFGWILRGRAVADVWMVPTRAELDAGAELLGYGITTRVLSTDPGSWKVTWNGVLTGVVMTLVGREVGGEIVQEGTYPDGKPTRWIFSEISSTSFRWRNEVSEDGGRTFQLRQNFVARRVVHPSLPPPLHQERLSPRRRGKPRGRRG